MLAFVSKFGGRFINADQFHHDSCVMNNNLDVTFTLMKQHTSGNVYICILVVEHILFCFFYQSGGARGDYV